MSTDNFENLIGGPLIALVHTQPQAAIAIVDFVNQGGVKQAGSQGSPNDSGLSSKIIAT